MSKLKCNIVQDLLPSFADGLVNEKTAEEIKEHLAECKDCKKLYKEMIKDEDLDFNKAEKEIDYLKKVKKKNKTIIISILSALIAVVIFTFGVYAFYGVADYGYYVSDLYVNQNVVDAKVNLLSSANKITRVSVSETDGVATIHVRSALFSFRYKTGSTEFGFGADNDIKKVQTADGRVLWENGEEISQKINDIYDAKVKYIGDNSAVSKLLQMIHICKELKCEDYNIQLFTDEEPYGLKIYNINSYDEMHLSFTNESYEEKIKGCAFIILACIENADFVQFDYIAPDGTENTYKLTVDEANEYLGVVSDGKSIKDFADSRQSLKTLIGTVS